MSEKLSRNGTFIASEADVSNSYIPNAGNDLSGNFIIHRSNNITFSGDCSITLNSSMHNISICGYGVSIGSYMGPCNIGANDGVIISSGMNDVTLCAGAHTVNNTTEYYSSITCSTTGQITTKGYSMSITGYDMTHLCTMGDYKIGTMGKLYYRSGVWENYLPNGDDEVATIRNINNLKDKVDDKTVSGTTIHIEDAVNYLAKDYTIEMPPTQTGSGTPTPSNPRTPIGYTGTTIYNDNDDVSKNNIYKTYGTQAGTTNTTVTILSNDSLRVQSTDNIAFTKQSLMEYSSSLLRTNKTYIVTAHAEVSPNSGARICITNSSGETIKGSEYGFESGDLTLIFTFISGYSSYYLSFNSDCRETDMTADITYTNIRFYELDEYQISFPAFGKNLLESLTAKKYNPLNDTTDNYWIYFDQFIPIIEDGTNYYFSSSFGLSRVDKFYKLYYDINGKLLFASYTSSVQPTGFTFNTYPDDDRVKFFKIAFNHTSSMSSYSFTNVQLELGNVKTTYEPFTNTAYGVTLNAAKGILTVNYKIVDLDNLNWTQNSNVYSTTDITDIEYAEYDFRYGDAFAEKYKVDVMRYISSNNRTNCIAVGPDKLSINTGSSSISPTGKLVYRLATPIVYQLPMCNILLAKGTNTIWYTNGTSATLIYSPNNLVGNLQEQIYDLQIDTIPNAGNTISSDDFYLHRRSLTFKSSCGPRIDMGYPDSPDSSVLQLIGYYVRTTANAEVSLNGQMGVKIISPCIRISNSDEQMQSGIHIAATYGQLVLRGDAPTITSNIGDTNIISNNDLILRNLYGKAYYQPESSTTHTPTANEEIATVGYVNTVFNSIINGNEVNY